MSYNTFLTIQWNGDKSALKTGLGINEYIQAIHVYSYYGISTYCVWP